MCARGRAWAAPSRDGAAPVSLFECGDVELLHLEHRLHGGFRVAGLGVAQHLAEHLRNDLPRNAESVLQPAAGSFLAAAFRELGPVPIDLLLRLAGDHEEHAFGEREGRAAVESEVLAPVELEGGVEQLAFGDRPVLLTALHAHDLRVGEERDVELHRLLSAVVENQTWSDHWRFSLWFLLLRRRSSSAANLSSRPSQIALYAVTNCESSRNGSGRSEYSLLRPSGRTTTKSASSRIASCRDPPGRPMSTTSTSSLIDRSPLRSASMIRRRVGSASTWNTSGIGTYYCSDIYRVNNMSSGCHALETAQVGQGLGDLLRQPHRLVAPQVDHLLGDAELEQFPGQLEQLAPVLAVPSELERAADLRGIAADLSAGGVELLDDLLDELGVSARDVPDVGVARREPERAVALGADPDRRIRLLDRFRIGDRVRDGVVAAVKIGPFLGEQRLDDLQRLAEPTDTMVEPLDAVRMVLDLSPRGADPKLEPAAGKVVDGDRDLGEHDRMAVRVAGDKAADADALGRLGHRGLQGPTFVDRPVGARRSDGSQVVEVPDVVEAAFVGDAPDRAQLLDGDALARCFQSETEWMSHEDEISGLVETKAADADRIPVLLREILDRHAEAQDVTSIFAQVCRFFVRGALRLRDGGVARSAYDLVTGVVGVEVQLHVGSGLDVADLDSRARIDKE